MNQQYNQDAEHLRILSICHYVLAGLCIFPFLYGLFYMFMGIFFGAMMAASEAPPAALFGGIFIFIGLAISVVALTVGLLLLKAGRNLAGYRNYMFCFVIACISCVFMPFGTILGVFTIIVLLRESVKARFGAGNYQQFGNGPHNWQ